MPEEEVGHVSDYFARVGVAGIELTSTLKVGDTIHLKGHTTDLQMTVSSMQLDRVEIQEGRPGQAIGIKVPDRVRHGDTVYKVVP
ncbi:MAG TPA: translation elongation factor-like protein [Dehalococcoidia bacterium]|nr:translation elongation factor-like protein [Dehalococcoidia bacterium]